MRDFVSLLLSYLRRHVKGLAAFLTFTAVFFFVFSLYSLDTGAVEYAALLSFVFGLLFVLADFLSYRKKHRQLQDARQRILYGLEELPPAADALERDYQELLAELSDGKKKAVFEIDQKRSDMIDYFTLWAHQIKTPIAAMRLLLQSERSPQNDELAVELFGIEQYVEMVLQYLRLDEMSSDLVLRRYPLADIVRQAVRKYARVFILKKITLDFKEPDCEVLTDEKWLEFVIEQLLSNALKYTRAGTISIFMKPDAERTLMIQDTGIGIQEEDLPRIFEKGFTGYNGRMDKKSTGIGLYLCKKILTKLSHTIAVRSKVGEGTVFEIDLSSADLEVE